MLAEMSRRQSDADVSGQSSGCASLPPTQSLLLFLHLPICLPSAVLCLWLPLKDPSPAIPTQSREVLHTHFEGEGRSQGIRSSHRLLHKPSGQRLLLPCQVWLDWTSG